MSEQGKCALAMTRTVIETTYGGEMTKRFDTLAQKHIGSASLDSLSDAEQVKTMNTFWNTVLSPLPDTINARAWLEDDCSVEEHVENFEKHWFDDVRKSGLLS